MESAWRILQLVRGAFLASIVLYCLIVGVLPSNVPRNLQFFRLITMVAVADVLAVFVLRRQFLTKAEDVLASDSQNADALQRWRTGYLIMWSCSEAVALFGVVLHFQGFTLKQVWPFLVAGFVLILFLAPRKPVEAR